MHAGTDLEMDSSWVNYGTTFKMLSFLVQIREESDEPIFAYVSASGIVTPAKVAQTPATATRPSTLRKSRHALAVLCSALLCVHTLSRRCVLSMLSQSF